MLKHQKLPHESQNKLSVQIEQTIQHYHFWKNYRVQLDKRKKGYIIGTEKSGISSFFEYDMIAVLEIRESIEML